MNIISNFSGVMPAGARINFSGIKNTDTQKYKEQENDIFVNQNKIDEIQKRQNEAKKQEKILLAKFMAGMIALQTLIYTGADKLMHSHMAEKNNTDIVTTEEHEKPDLYEFKIGEKNYTVLGENVEKENPFSIYPQKEETLYFPLKDTEQEARTQSVIPEGTLKGVLTGKESVVEELCSQYSVEPKFITALIGAETGWGSTGVSDQNNPMSYRASGDLGIDGNGFGIFSTPEAGLETGIRNIASYRERYGITSIDIDHADEIGEIYAGGDTNWSDFVRECYYSIK